MTLLTVLADNFGDQLFHLCQRFTLAASGISYQPTSIKAAAINPINTKQKHFYIFVGIIQTMQAQQTIIKNQILLHPSNFTCPKMRQRIENVNIHLDQ